MIILTKQNEINKTQDRTTIANDSLQLKYSTAQVITDVHSCHRCTEHDTCTALQQRLYYTQIILTLSMVYTTNMWSSLHTKSWITSAWTKWNIYLEAIVKQPGNSNSLRKKYGRFPILTKADRWPV